MAWGLSGQSGAMGTSRFLAALALGVALTACGGGGKAAITSTTGATPTSAPPPSVATSTSAVTVGPPTTAVTTTELTTTSTTATAGTAACTSAALSVSLGRSDAGAGHVGTTLLFKNTGKAPCRLSGYPGVAALDANGAQVAQARRTANGYLGGLQSGLTTGPEVTLAPGGVASALVEGHRRPVRGGDLVPVVSHAAGDSAGLDRVDPADPGHAVSRLLRPDGASGGPRRDRIQLTPATGTGPGVTRSRRRRRRRSGPTAAPPSAPLGSVDGRPGSGRRSRRVDG